jgi:hypothetical protein
MLKIGMDKTDRTFRHFEYDDERRYGNPQVYKVLYEESGVFGEVLCSNVISIKKSTNSHNHFLDIPLYNESGVCEISKQKHIIDKEKNVEIEQQIDTQEEKKKIKSVKTKSKTSSLKGERIENKEISLDVAQISPKTYEYEVFVVDNVSYIDDVKTKLNEFGKDGWEVCGFQIVQKMFGGGCQAVIIMKKGLN